MDLVLANNRDHFSRLDGAMLPGELERWRREDAELALLACGWPASGPAMRVLPLAPPRAALADRADRVMVPSGSARDGVCRALLAAPSQLDALAGQLADATAVRPLLWSSEPLAYAVLDALADRGVHIDRAALPAPDVLAALWALDTKSGFRALALDCPGLRLAPGVVVAATAGAVIAAIGAALAAAGRAVVKADRSVGGWGQATFATAPDERGVTALLGSSGLWRVGRVVVEQRLAIAVSPSVDAEVAPDGATRVVTLADQLLDGNRACVGASWPTAATAGQIVAIERSVRQLGAALAARGHRGPFNTDFVITPAGAVHVVEVNLRRSLLSVLPLVSARRAHGAIRLDAVSLAGAGPATRRWRATHSPPL